MKTLNIEISAALRARIDAARQACAEAKQIPLTACSNRVVLPWLLELALDTIERREALDDPQR
jgi:hypothetical protein